MGALLRTLAVLAILTSPFCGLAHALEIKPWGIEQFVEAVQSKEIVRMEVVRMSQLRLAPTTIDRDMLDSFIDEEVYEKYPELDCDIVLDDDLRSNIVTEFLRYPASWRRHTSEMNWRIVLLDKHHRARHRIYLGQLYTGQQDLDMIVDGAPFGVDKRFEAFFRQNFKLGHCAF